MSLLYLDTVDRSQLDFDFEKLCSVSLVKPNCYCCLTCGKYFQGRGKSSHAYYHSMTQDHHVFINLESLKVYVLPEAYEVNHNSLDDIKYVINPSFREDLIRRLDSEVIEGTALNGKKYVPGFVGLNNMKRNDYINAVVHAIAHVKPLRDFFLLDKAGPKTEEIADRFAMLIRKMYNPKAFKTHVSPHEFVQEVTRASKKRFSGVTQGDPIAFLSWLLNSLHKGLGSKKRGKSIIHECFQGELLVQSQAVASIGSGGFGYTKVYTPFLFLTLEPPPRPLFAEDDKNGIPQIQLTDLLRRFDGRSSTEVEDFIKTYSISKLPEYLIFCIKRFSKNNFLASEKNPTIINFPIKDLDMSNYLSEDNGDLSTKFDLVANIIYEGSETEGVFKVEVVHPCNEQWYKIQDLYVDHIMAQMIILSESYIQIWKKQDI